MWSLAGFLVQQNPQLQGAAKSKTEIYGLEKAQKTIAKREDIVREKFLGKDYDELSPEEQEERDRAWELESEKLHPQKAAIEERLFELNPTEETAAPVLRRTELQASEEQYEQETKDIEAQKQKLTTIKEEAQQRQARAEEERKSAERQRQLSAEAAQKRAEQRLAEEQAARTRIREIILRR